MLENITDYVNTDNNNFDTLLSLTSALAASQGPSSFDNVLFNPINSENGFNNITTSELFTQPNENINILASLLGSKNANANNIPDYIESSSPAFSPASFTAPSSPASFIAPSSPAFSDDSVLNLSSLPMNKRMVLDGPQNFSNPLVNTAFNTFAPILASTLAGGGEAQMLPQITGDVGAYRAFYSRDITTPLYETTKQRQLQQLGAGLGATAGTILGNLGLAPEDMSGAEFLTSMSDLGASTIGQIATAGFLSTETGQAIMGGNPLAMIDKMYPMFQKFSTPVGMMVNPMDTIAQAGIAESGSQFVSALTDAIYTDPVTGIRGITPQTEFTRGHSAEDIASLTGYMANRNFSYDAVTDAGTVETMSMRGLETTTEQKIAMVGDQLSMLDAVGEVIQKSDLASKIAAIELVTQGNNVNISPEKLRGVMDNLSSQAELLQVSSKAMFDGLVKTQSVMGAISGGMVTASGQVIGGSSSLMASDYMESQIQMIAHDTGRNANDVRAEQIGLMQMGMQSSQGKSIRTIEFMRQQGVVRGELYDQYQEALRTGNKNVQQDIEEQIYAESPFGSRQAAYAQMSDPNFMREIEMRSTDETATRAIQAIDITQETEFEERIEQTRQRQKQTMAQSLAREIGVPIPTLDDDSVVLDQVNAMAGVLRQTEGGDFLADLVQNQFIEAGGGREGMQAVQRLMSSDQFDTFRGDMRIAADTVRTDNLISALDSPNAMAAANVSGQINALRTISDTPETREAINQARTAIKEGRPERAQDIINNASVSLNNTQREFLRRSGEQAEDSAQAKLNALTNVGVETEGGGGSYALIEAMTAPKYGIAGFSDALKEGFNSVDRVAELKELSEEGAVIRRETRDANAARRQTMPQRLVEWAQGRQDIFDVLGVQVTPEMRDNNALSELTPDKLMAMTEKDMAKLPEEQRQSVQQLRDYLKTDQGAQELAQASLATNLGKLSNVNTKLVEAGNAPISIQDLSGMSEEDFSKRFKFADLTTRAELNEVFEFASSDVGRALTASESPVQRDQGKFLQDNVEANAEKNRTVDLKRGERSTTQISGTVTLRRTSSGSEILDFEGAELN